jgi:diguanylate cyclase (GGDEF)-like protein/PAS domain S-box-containing protein
VSKAIKLLVVEDSEDDARLLIRTLRRGGFEVQHERVESAAAMAAALQRQSWDAVVSDYNMPGFSGLDALGVLRAMEPDIPFVLVSGTAGEELAVDALKAGVGDYVLKKNLSRLPLVLERELAEAEVRRARRQSEVELRKLSLAVRQSGTGIVITDPKGAIDFVNPKFEAMTGYSASEIMGRNPRFLGSGLTPPETYRDLWETITAGREWHGEIQNRKKTGELYWEVLHISPVFDDSGGILHFIAVKDDVTEKKRVEAELRESVAGLRQAQQVAKLGHAVTRPDGSFESWSESLPVLIGMDSEGMPKSTREWIEILHPDDRGVFRDRSIEAGKTQTRGDIEYRLRRGDGAWIHIRHLIEPLQEQADPAGRTRWFNTVQDVSEQKHDEDRIRRLNRIYAVLSGINALIVRVQAKEELYAEACRIAVEAGGFRLAWLGVVDRKEMRVRPVAWHGPGENYIQLMPLQLSDPVSERTGLSGRAVMEHKAMVSDDMTRDPRVALRKEALERGLHSLAILPLLVGGEVVGVLALYAGEVGFFDEEEMKLLNELAGDIAFALDHIEKATKLSYLAYYDALTGLANRTLFLDRLNESVHAAARSQGKFALVLADLERLRTVNESLGRHAGDELLKHMAERLARVGGRAEVGRISADEFAVVVPTVKGRSEAGRIVQALLHSCFDEPFAVIEAKLRVSAKTGIALYPNDGGDAETLLKHAEAALRKGKETGERFAFYTRDLTERTSATLTLETKLRQALENEEFVLHYQPKVELETRQIVGVEALIRWQSSDLGLVPPMKFIPLMEETGMILDVGTWALRRAAIDHRSWVEQGLQAPRVAVNVSAIQLRQRDFVGALKQAISEGIAPTGIDLEITESLIMRDIEGNIQKLKEVRAMGLGVAIDDFGTGYSSLAYLAKLPVQTLKIDRSFIITMHNDPDTMTLVQTIISLAHSLRLTVVAEGVDAEEQAKTLHLLRCDQMQGYLFSRPVPFDQMTALLKQGVTV